MTDDPTRDAFNSTFETASDRERVLLDGYVPPPPALMTAPAPGSAASGITDTPQPASTGPGFFSSLWTGIKDAAPAVGKALLEDAARRGASVNPGQVVAAPLPEGPSTPKWLPWAIVGGLAALVIAWVWD